MPKELTSYTLVNIRPFILGEDIDTKRELQNIDAFLKRDFPLESIRWERKLEVMFYTLIIKLRLFSIETPEMEKLFHSFLEEVEKQISKITANSLWEESTLKWIKKFGLAWYAKSQLNSINRRLKLLENKVHLNQMKAFLYMCEHYIHVLERFYKDMSMSDRILELYVMRMNIKRNRYFFNKDFGLYAGFSLFRSISSYGTSFVRLSITCTLSVAFFASIYWFADYFAPEGVRMIAHLDDYSSYFFNSLVTISGLWIDASPQTALQRIAMGVNTIYGMIVFGMLFNVISTKLSMNN